MHKNEYVDLVNSLLKSYVQCEEQIQMLTERRAELKQQMSDAFESAGDYLTAEVRREVAYHWYWHTSIDTSSIGLFLDVHPNYVGSTVGPLPSGYFCECGAEEMYTSRTARQTIDSARKEMGFQCDSCRELAREKSREEWQRQMEEREIEIEHLKTMPYDEYLKTEHWQRVRRSALKRAGYRCQLCSANARLQVHHNTYENRGEEKPQDIVALCEDCHQKHHGIGRRYAIPDEYSDIIID